MVNNALWILLTLWVHSTINPSSNHNTFDSCDIGTQFLQTQEDVDAFAKSFAMCDRLQGELIISGPSIMNLDSLQAIHSIDGSVSILYCDSLPNLHGLSGLKKIGGPLIISNNDLLTSLSGLDSLTQVEGELTIANSPHLESLTGLDGLDQILLKSISIHDNPNLNTCNTNWICNFIQSGRSASTYFKNNAPGCSDYFQIVKTCSPDADCPIGALNFYSKKELDDFKTAFPNCKDLEGSIWIQNIEDSADLNGLSNIESVSEYIVIRENAGIHDLKGLGALTSVGDFLVIQSNSNLTALSGLDRLKYSSGISLNNNPALANIESLNTVDSCTNLYILGCSSLSLCNSDFVCAYLTKGGKSFFQNNGPQCENKFQILKSCDTTLVCPPGDLQIQSMQELEAFKATFPNCTDLYGSLIIAPFDDKSVISDLDGLIQLKSITGSLEISNTSGLVDVKGLDSIHSIGDGIHIEHNTGLVSLSGLKNLLDFNGDILLTDNINLVDISNLNFLDTSSVHHITITDNSALAACDIDLLCRHLSSGKPYDVQNNYEGCNTAAEIQRKCTQKTCAQTDLIFTSQEQINQFPKLYGDCHTFNSVEIRGLNIVDVDSLYPIHALLSNLSIDSNAVLKSLSGLHELTSIQGTLSISGNDLLENVSDLNNLDDKGITSVIIRSNSKLKVCTLDFLCDYLNDSAKIAVIDQNASGCNTRREILTSCEPIQPAICPYGTLVIMWQIDIDSFKYRYPNCTHIPGHLVIFGPDIVSLEGLSGLRTIDGQLEIRKTPLTSLQGLEQLDYKSLDGLILEDNLSLQTCAIALVCNYIQDTSNYIKINNNASGCSTYSDVKASCDTTIDLHITPPHVQPIYSTYHSGEPMQLYPNPTSGTLSIRNKDRLPITNVEIKDIMGRSVKYISSSQGHTIDLSRETPGIYIISISTPGKQWIRKVLKQ